MILFGVFDTAGFRRLHFRCATLPGSDVRFAGLLRLGKIRGAGRKTANLECGGLTPLFSGEAEGGE